MLQIPRARRHAVWEAYSYPWVSTIWQSGTPDVSQFQNHQVSSTTYRPSQCKNVMKHGRWENATGPQHSPQGNSKFLYKRCWVGTSLQSDTYRTPFHSWYKTQSKSASPIPHQQYNLTDNPAPLSAEFEGKKSVQLIFYRGCCWLLGGCLLILGIFITWTVWLDWALRH